jgi:aubergine
VDFLPAVDIPGIKRNLIRQQQIGSFLFDGGSQLYLLNPLEKDTTVLQGRTREGEEYTLTLRKTRKVLYTEGTFLQVMNLTLRDSMRELRLQLVGRDFFDAEAAVSFLISVL